MIIDIYNLDITEVDALQYCPTMQNQEVFMQPVEGHNRLLMLQFGTPLSRVITGDQSGHPYFLFK